MKNPIRNTTEFKALRKEAREAIVAYADSADFDVTVSRLAEVGFMMEILLN